MREKRLIYENYLRSKEDVSDWIIEGEVLQSFDQGLILENAAPESLGDHAHFTMWLPECFPDNLLIEWEFKPLREPGLCMLFFSALAKSGESIFSSELAKRDGYYPQYHSGDINAYHISYFRHKYESERAFRTCNLRKSAGFHFITQGADPLPPVEDVIDAYRMSVDKFQGKIRFSINDLLIFEWQDDGTSFGPILTTGAIGFRQMAPMKARYANLKVYEWIKNNKEGEYGFKYLDE